MKINKLPWECPTVRSCAIMNFNDQNQQCHPERSEGSRTPKTKILRCAQDDISDVNRSIANKYFISFQTSYLSRKQSRNGIISRLTLLVAFIERIKAEEKAIFY
jgi:hypothetical protein